MRSRRRAVILLSSATIGVALAGCSGSDDSTAVPETPVTGASSTVAPPSSTGTTTITTTTTTTTTTTSTGRAPGPDDTTVTAPSSIPVAETIETVPEGGVPGIESEDAFCRAWAEFAGSFQSLALVSGLGDDPVEASRLEVLASSTVVSAAQTLDAELPESVARERDVFVDGVVGPFARRAVLANDELLALGLDDGDLDRLADSWLAALTAAGVDDLELVVDVPDDLAVDVEAATTAFAAAVPAIVDDPTLVTAAAAPATFAYLTDSCPDQGTLGGNDAID